MNTLEHWMTTGLLGAGGTFQRAAREYAEEFAAMAVASELEAIIAEIPGGSVVDPQWVCDMIRERGVTRNVKRPGPGLIAAEPDMIGALRKAVVLLAGVCAHSPELWPNDTYEAVSAAIAKATAQPHMIAHQADKALGRNLDKVKKVHLSDEAAHAIYEAWYDANESGVDLVRRVEAAYGIGDV